MKGRGSVRSSAAVSAASVAVSLVLSCFLFAVGFKQPGAWVVLAIILISAVFHLANLTRDEGVPHTEFSFQVEQEAPFAVSADSPAERLRDLYRLHEDGLLTDDEFLAKRELVLADTGDSPAERLRDLDRLHGEGLLTDDEFLSKRESILSQL